MISDDQNSQLDLDPEIEDHKSCDISTDVTSHEAIFDQKRATTSFLLKVQEILKVSLMALDDLITKFSFLCSTELASLQTKVFSCLCSSEVDPQQIDGLHDTFIKCSLNNPFSGLTSGIYATNTVRRI